MFITIVSWIQLNSSFNINRLGHRTLGSKQVLKPYFYNYKFRTLVEHGFQFKCLQFLFNQFNISLSFKYGTTFREVLKAPTFEICQVINSSSENFLISKLINSGIEAAPNLFRCPYRGTLEAYNISLPYKYYKFLPTGDFKIIVITQLTENGKVFANYSAQFQYKNSLRQQLKT